MSTRTPGEDVPIRRLDRILAFMSIGLVVLSIVCFFAVMIGTATGMAQEDFAGGVWPVVALLPMIALPLAFLVIVALLIMNMVRRARANRGG
jgi:FtsH-binding integral membrane protein